MSFLTKGQLKNFGLALASAGGSLLVQGFRSPIKALVSLLGALGPFLVSKNNEPGCGPGCPGVEP